MRKGICVMKNDIPLLKRLGAVPFWRGQDRFLPSLETMYRRAGERAAAALESTRHTGQRKSPTCAVKSNVL